MSLSERQLGQASRRTHTAVARGLLRLLIQRRHIGGVDAAVDQPAGAGHIAGGIGAEEQRHLGHLDRLAEAPHGHVHRSEEHTSELQSLMRISYAVFCLKKKTPQTKKLRNKYKTVLYNKV